MTETTAQIALMIGPEATQEEVAQDVATAICDLFGPAGAVPLAFERSEWVPIPADPTSGSPDVFLPMLVLRFVADHPNPPPPYEVPTDS